MGIRQWKLPEFNPDLIRRLADATGQPALLCRILAARGFTDPDMLGRFVGDDDALDDPMLLAGMPQAVERIQQALADGERICVYGDYDCDGVTATALLVSYLQTVGSDVIYYVPSREREGYGLNTGAIDMLLGQKVELIVTVDNGISAHEEIAHANTLGIDVVVTDHHTPRDTLPPAVAVVNPHRTDCPSRYKELAGVGVAFKLICALEGVGPGDDELLEYYSDFVTLGTIADVVPLTGENRTIVRYGLARLPETQNSGLAALIEVSGLRERALTSESVAFGVIPRINAAGRIGAADDVIELLLTDDADAAVEIAEAVNEQNVQRKKIEDGILTEIEGILAGDPALLKRRVLIVAGKDWHHGVVGIVSAKLVERYDRPCIVFSIDGGEARGSGRSVKGFSLIEAISDCSERLTRYGGHNQAAGLTIPIQYLAEFDNAIQQYAREHYEVMPLPELAADCSLNLAELTVENIAQIERLEPFGAENESPLFHLAGLVIEGIYPTNDHKHIRIRFAGARGSFYAIYFGVSDAVFPYKTGETVEIMAKISVQEYNGQKQLSVKISDLRPGGVPQERVLLDRERYACFQRSEEQPATALEGLVPTRDDIAVVYRFLRKAGKYTCGADALYLQLMSTGIDYGRALIALDVLEEMGLVRRAGASGATLYEVVPDPPKVDLASSAILASLKQPVSTV